MKRTRGTMGMGLFDKIIAEAARIPEIGTLTLTGLGEPLLDKRLAERIRRARLARTRAQGRCDGDQAGEPAKPKREIDPMAALKADLQKRRAEAEAGDWLINLYTSGSHLTLAKAKELHKAGLDEVYVSLNAANAQARQELMKLNDYDQVVANIEAIRQHCPGLRVVVKGFSDSSMIDGEDRQEFVSKWHEGESPGSAKRSVFLHSLGNWAGQLYPMRITPRKACGRALGQIMVLWDGRVSLCCFDGEGEVIFGDLSSQALKEVFNGPLATRYREMHAAGRRDELELCKNCTMI